MKRLQDAISPKPRKGKSDMKRAGLGAQFRQVDLRLESNLADASSDLLPQAQDTGRIQNKTIVSVESPDT